MTQRRNQSELCQSADGATFHVVEFDDRPAGSADTVNVAHITSGCAAVKGRDVIFREGEIFAADDPLVKQCPLFSCPSPR